MVDFDYVIVGAGTAGCVLDSQRSEDRATGCSCWSTAAMRRTPCCMSRRVPAMAVAWIAADLILEDSSVRR